MGFCTKEEHRRFLEVCPEVEQFVVDDGIQLIKYWLEVSNDEQKRRFEARINDPLRQWKLSPMDLPSRSRWYDYSHARDVMLKATDTKFAPWYILRSDNKKRARLNCISHLLSLIPYKKVLREKVKLPTPKNKGNTMTRPAWKAGTSCRRNIDRIAKLSGDVAKTELTKNLVSSVSRGIVSIHYHRRRGTKYDIDQILLAVTVMITATVVAGSVAKQLNLGSIVALLVVGMALGPHSPRPLLTGHVEELQTVGEIGVILLLFLVGLETQPEKLSSMRRLFFGLGTAQYLLTAVAIAGLLIAVATSTGNRPSLSPSVLQ